MKRFFNSLLVLVLTCYSSNAQTYKIQYKRTPNIEYQLRNVKDPNIRERVASQLSTNIHYFGLTCANALSVYEPIQKLKDREDYIALNTSGLNSYFKDSSKKTYKVKTSIQGNTYVVEDSLKHYDWKLFNEYKTIIGYTCQKATTQVSGENITAWFTQEIPIHSGPQLFYIKDVVILGLDVNTFQVEAVGFQKLEKTELIKISFSGVPITQKQYDKKLNTLKFELKMNN